MGKFNVAFEAYFLLAQPDNCIDVLVKAKRVSEATLFARAYAPSRLQELTALWTASLKEQGLPFQPEDVTTGTEAEKMQAELQKEALLR